MDAIAAHKARTNLSQLLDRVARGENLVITRHGRSVARLVPVVPKRDQAREAAARIIERRQHIQLVPLAELMDTSHLGHTL